ncbi:MAG TPA: crosslink repair DNA glycosylase YcaQ family protein [Gaiellaceae bacterium]|nr:crosslink repair DNA glycosylase YcaQ family protein [Gaiellaceae bacterium]
MSVAQARRIAVRSQLLDGSATSVLETVRRLGFLQLDPISSVAPPQYLVLWSRLGPYDREQLDRLLWEERRLVEWRAFLWPIEDLPFLRARMHHTVSRRRSEYLQGNKAFRRYVLRELEKRGPLLSRDIETHQTRKGADRHDWWGARQMGLMLEVLAARGEVAVAGRRGKQRVWDLAERVYPPTDRASLAEAEAHFAEKRFRSLGVRLDKGKWIAHTDAVDGSVPARTTFLSPFDRLIHDRARTEALWDFYYRLEMYVPKAKREYGYYVLPILRGDRIVGRIEPVWDRKAGELQVNGVWWEPGVKPLSLAKPLRELTRWLSGHGRE